MKILVSNIRWDTSDEDYDDLDDLGLPSSVELEVDEDINPEYDLADILSDEYGFCVEGFTWTKLP